MMKDAIPTARPKRLIAE